jgi:hypothetical protein
VIIALPGRDFGELEFISLLYSEWCKNVYFNLIFKKEQQSALFIPVGLITLIVLGAYYQL